MEPLDLLHAPLSGMNLIEAGAGTGKTHTITGLFLRLVLETEIPVENILVVTYTKAATAELRERIRKKLVEARAAFAGAYSDDELLVQLVALAPDPGRWARLLQRAVLDFDRAAIFTIHGFCQRALADSAFESAAPFATDMLLDEQELVQEIVDDFWRIEIQDASRGLIDYLIKQNVTTDSLTAFLHGKLSKPYLQIHGTSEVFDLESMEKPLALAFTAARDCWQTASGQVGDLLRESSGLNRNKYRLSSVENWLAAMDAYLAGSPGQISEGFKKFTSSELQQSLKKGGTAPEHDFFTLCETLLAAWTALETAYSKSLVALHQRLIEYANNELPHRKALQRLQSYDDLLLNLNQALQTQGGEQLVASLLRQYRAALIDEFQDTDPIQYAIFSRIYAGSSAPVYLVGDPKQAIYSFRGADIFAYLKAREGVEGQFTLVTNWRSDPALIDAVNMLFNQENSFLFSEIGYHQALPAEKPRKTLVDPEGGEAVFRVGYIPKENNAEQSVALVADETAGEIARLLAGGVMLGDSPLSGGDIAVLVRSHRQGERIRQALLVQGIHSVQRSQDDVFQSWQALELERLLQAILLPGRESLLRAALGTDMLGLTSVDIENLGLDDAALEQQQMRLLDYNRLWREQGFMPMFRHLLHVEAIPRRLLRLESGERRLTNLFQLSELLHRYERDNRPSLEGLVNWLSHRRASDQAEDEEHQIRLESDENLVQIVTVHKSKGLQYPVVFVPFAWDGGLRSGTAGGRGGKGRQPYQFHDPAGEHQPVLELGSERWEEDLVHARREEMSENLRLLYVALTRAEHRCYLSWGNVGSAGESALGWLLHPVEDLEEGSVLGLKNRFKSLDDSVLLNKFKQLSNELDNALNVTVLDQQNMQGRSGVIPIDATPTADDLRAREFPQRTLQYSRVTSFSALAHHGGDSELPDYDRLTAASEEADLTVVQPALDIFTFPKGAQAGSCLHAIFEELDFTHSDKNGLDALVSLKLAEFGFSDQWLGVIANMVRQVLDTPLENGSDLKLSQVDDQHKLVELPFYYPVEGIESRALGEILRKHGYVNSKALERAVGQLRFSDISGYMKGFIDLVFQHQGRFYLLDYKSNWLGNRVEHYDQPALAEAMAREGYFLQYLLYTLALHRYLRQRLADYDYESHFGGALYLFLRGMNPASSGDYGVFRDCPSRALVDALDHFLTTGEVAA